MLLAAALAWLGAAAVAQMGPVVPPFSLHYLGANDRQAVPARATTILFQGGFTFGATAAMQAALDAAPHAVTVAFDSPGGRLGAADGVADLIRDRRLATRVTRRCASACTMAYVAGTVRTAGPDARFYFHLGSGPVLTDFVAKVAVKVEQPWFIRGGVSLAFAARALHAPNGEPYLAPLDELVAAGYVQRIVPPMPPGVPAPRLVPLLQAIGALEPDTRTALLGGQAGPDAMELRAGLVANRWLGRSMDTAAAALVDATLAILDTLTTADARACMQWLVGLNDQATGFAAIPPPLRDRLRAAQAGVLQDAAAHASPVPTDPDGRLSSADTAVRQAVKARFGPQALVDAASPEHAFDDPARSCTATAAYLHGLRDRPEGGRLLRWALASG